MLGTLSAAGARDYGIGGILAIALRLLSGSSLALIPH
jgi:hypothetical protein